MPHPRLACLAAVLCTVATTAQSEPPAPLEHRDRFDSGWLDHRHATPLVVASHTAHVPGAAWLRVAFGDCHLPTGSELQLTGLRDGAVQRFDARSLRDYQFGSAYFNGDTVRIDLVAGPWTHANRLALQHLLYADGRGTDVGICGPTDTRVLSQDPRIGRLGGCCTMFLLGVDVLATAGHCLGSASGIVSFQVPLSDANGNPQYPPPEHQYAFRAGSATSANGGLGNDWCVVAAVRNSNTHRYPGEVQGFFHWTTPQNLAGQTVAVTGYGSHATPTWSLAQKTHSGPRSSPNPSVLEFGVHVSGCNSGSPVVELASQRALGITTHAGCTSTGGANYGTGFGNQGLTTALQWLISSHYPGTTETFGQGCGGAAGVPTLSFAGIPDLAQPVTVQVAGLEPGANRFGALLLGFSSSSWSGGQLPSSLAGYGLAGCHLYVRPDATVFLPTNFGANSFVQTLPSQPWFVGTPIHCQYLALDPTAPNAVGGVASNAGRIRIGN